MAVKILKFSGWIIDFLKPFILAAASFPTDNVCFFWLDKIWFTDVMKILVFRNGEIAHSIEQ
jgi:hypothetical protein